MIGIIGGVGPLAGVNLVKRIIEETHAITDQDHLPVLLSSQPNRIPDRTAYLVGKEQENPGEAISKIAIQLEQAGAHVLGIPSNTAHSPRIFDVIQEELAKRNSSVKLLHIVEETAKFIKEHFKETDIGVLSTIGTRNTGLYQRVLAEHGINCFEPQEELQQKVHMAVYDETYGIKANSSPVTNRAYDELLAAIHEIKAQGAKIIILASNQLSLALREKSYFGLPTIDPNRILARAFIQEIAPNKLKPYID